MSKRRDAGDGSLYQDQSSGRWVAQIETAPDERTGRRRYVRRTRKTKTEARAALKELLREREAGLVADRRTTLATYVEDWLANVLPHTAVRPRTIHTYATVLGNYMLPYIGSKRLADLTVEDVEGVTRTLAERGLSDLTIDHAVTTLGTLLDRALRHGYVTRNVARLAKRDRARGKPAVKVAPLTADEAAKVLAVARGHRLGIAAVLALYCGLRKGEVLALRWSDIEGLDDDDVPTMLHVRHTLRALPGGGHVIEAPKTLTSRRTIPLNGVSAELRQHRARQREERMKAGPLWRNTDALVATTRGGWTDASALHRAWHGWCEDAGVGRPRFHAARHTTATLLRRAGVDLDHVAAVLGHTSITITSDTYADVAPADVAADLARLDGMLAGSTER